MEIKKDKIGFWCGDLLVTPYVTDEVLAAAYLQFSKDGLLPIIFHEATPTLRWFLDTFSHEKMTVLACGRNTDGVFDLLGLGWINSYGGLATHNKSEVGMAFIRKAQDRVCTQTFTFMMIEYAFDQLKMDAIFAVTPEPNRAAVIHNRRVGFTMYGPVPMYTAYDGKPCGAYWNSMTREQWLDRAVFSEASESVEELSYVRT